MNQPENTIFCGTGFDQNLRILNESDSDYVMHDNNNNDSSDDEYYKKERNEEKLRKEASEKELEIEEILLVKLQNN